MADNIELASGSGGAILATDDVASVHYQRVKLVDGTLENTTAIAAGGGGEAGALRVTIANDSTGVVSVDDNGAALTIDWAGVDPPIGAGTEAAALRVTLATDSTGLISIDDNGGSLTVDNAGTFAVQVVDSSFAVADGSALGEGVLIQGDDGTDRKNINVDATTGDVQVDVTNTVTVAAHAVTNAGTFVVQEDGAALTALQLIDNPVFADDAAFTLGSSSVNVSGAIRDDGLTTLTAIEGDAVPLRVSATGALHVTGGGGGTEYTEDAAAAADPSGSAVILVRQDTPATLVTTDGDNVAQRATNYGAAFVQILDSSGNFINTFGGAGGTSATDDAAFTAGAGTGTPAMGFFSADTVDAGDSGVLAMDASRRLLVSIEADNVGIGGGTQYAVNAAAPADPTGTAGLMERDDGLTTLTEIEGDWTQMRANARGALWVELDLTSDVTIADGGNSLTVDNAGTFAVQIVDTSFAVADGNALGEGVLIQGDDGTDRKNINVDATTGDVQVDVTNTVTVAAHAVTNAGTFVVQEDGAALTALQKLDNIAHAGADVALAEHVPISGQFDDAATTTVTENQVAPVRITSGRALHVAQQGTATVAGTITADAGTNLNTSALALETGGNLATVAGAVTGTEMQVDVVAALPAGTNAIGKLAANTGVDIGDVDVTSVVPGTAATNLGKAVDSAAAGTDTGIALLAVRDDEYGTAAITPIDGDYTTLRTDRFGSLKISQLPDATSEIKYGVIDAASSGDNTLQAAAGAGVKIRVLSVFLVSAGTVTARFESGASGTALTGQMNLVVNSGFVLPFNPAGWFETADNALLNLELSGAISVDGSFSYVEV